MQYKPKPNLIKKIAAYVLAPIAAYAPISCYLTPEEVLGGALGIASDSERDPLKRAALNLASNAAGKAGQRRADFEIDKRAVDLEVYRERRMRELNEEFRIKEEKLKTGQTMPVANDATVSVLEQVLDRSSINTRTIIDTVENEYALHPEDYERNVGMIDRAFKVEGTTTDDESRLVNLLENMSKTITTIKKFTAAAAVNPKGKIIALEYILTCQKVFSLKTEQFVALDYIQLIENLQTSFGDKEAISYLKERIKALNKIGNKQYTLLGFNPKKAMAGHHPLESIEDLLQSRLKRQNPQKYTEQVKALKSQVEEAQRLLKKQEKVAAQKYLEENSAETLAKEIGFSFWFWHEIGKHLSTEPVQKQ